MTSEAPFPLYDALTGTLTAPGFRWLSSLSRAEQAEFLHDHERLAVTALANLNPNAAERVIQDAYREYAYAHASQVGRELPSASPHKPGWFWLGGDNVVFYLVMLAQHSAIVAPVVWDCDEAVKAANEHDYIVPDVPTKGANTAVLLSLAREIPLEQLARLYPIGPLHLPWNLELHAAYAKLHGKALPEFNADNMGDEDCWHGVEPRFLARKLADERMAALENGGEFSTETLYDIYERRDRRVAAKSSGKSGALHFLHFIREADGRNFRLAAETGQPAGMDAEQRLRAMLQRPEAFSVVVKLEMPAGFARSERVTEANPLVFFTSVVAQSAPQEYFKAVTFKDDHRPCLVAAQNLAFKHTLRLPEHPQSPRPMLLGREGGPIEGLSATLALAISAFAMLTPGKGLPKWVAALAEVKADGTVKPVDILAEKLQATCDFLEFVGASQAVILVAAGTPKPDLGCSFEMRQVATLDEAVRVVWGDAELNKLFAAGNLQQALTDLEQFAPNTANSRRVLDLSQSLLHRILRELKADPHYLKLLALWRVHVLRFTCFDHLGQRAEAAQSRAEAQSTLDRLANWRDNSGQSLLRRLPPGEAKSIIDLVAHSLQSQHEDEFDFDSADAGDLLGQLDEWESENLDESLLLRVHGTRIHFHRYRYLVDRQAHGDSLAEIKRLMPLYEQAFARQSDPHNVSHRFGQLLENDLALLGGDELRGTLGHFRDYFTSVGKVSGVSAAFCLLHGGVLARELAFAGIPLLPQDRHSLLELLDVAQPEFFATAVGELGLLIADYLNGDIIKDEFDLRVSDCMTILLAWATPEGMALIAPALAGKSALLVAKALMLKAKEVDAESLIVVRAGVSVLQRLAEAKHSKPLFEADCAALSALIQRPEAARLEEFVAMIDRLCGKIRF